jgi:hypothetical protein
MLRQCAGLQSIWTAPRRAEKRRHGGALGSLSGARARAARLSAAPCRCAVDAAASRTGESATDEPATTPRNGKSRPARQHPTEGLRTGDLQNASLRILIVDDCRDSVAVQELRGEIPLCSRVSVAAYELLERPPGSSSSRRCSSVFSAPDWSGQDCGWKFSLNCPCGDATPCPGGAPHVPRRVNNR